jgi:hypothetical protein
MFLRSCKQCGNTFEVQRIDSGRGSANVFRKVFCSDSCKNLFGRRKTTDKIEASCHNCSKTFLRYPSQRGKFCSYECKNTSQKRFKSNTCKRCSTVFTQKPTRLNGSYCSWSCFTSDVVPSTWGRSGYRIDLGGIRFRSSLEADFQRVMNHLNIVAVYEPKTFRVGRHTYTPDFFLPEFDMYVELKGLESKTDHPHEADWRKNLDKIPCVETQYRIKVLIVTQKEFVSAIKDANLWTAIPNLEQRSYKKTAYLVIKHEDQTTPSNHPLTTNHTD